MSISKVQFDGNDLINLENDTAVESDVAQGKTFHKANGERATGTFVGGGEPAIAPLSVTENGTYTAPDGADGYSPVTVNVPVPVNSLLYAVNTDSMFAKGKKHFPENFTVEIGEYWQSASKMFSSDESRTPCEHLTIISDGHPTDLNAMFSEARASSPETIELDFDTSHVTTFASMFSNIYNTKYITGRPFDFSSATSVSSMFFLTTYGLQNLLDVRFAENTLGLSISFGNHQRLSKQSLISIANGLSESAAGKTLTLYSAKKDELLSIIGSISSDESNTYSIFSEDADGTVSLLDFINNTKGWAVA